MLKRGWWIAALVLLIGLTLWLRRPTGAPGAPPQQNAPVPPSGAPTLPTPPVRPPDSPDRSVQTPPSVPPEQQPKTGRLRVSITSPAGAFSGVLALLSPAGPKLAQQNAFGEGTGSFEFDQLPPGPCRVVFVPTKGGAPASSEGSVPEQGEGTASLTLPAATRLRGIVLDALQRPLPGATLSVTLPGVVGRFPPQNPSSLLLSGSWSQSISSPAGAGPIRSGGYSLGPDGTLRLSATSAKDGSFAITGLPAGAVQVEVRYQKLHFTQACSPDAEASILVPVQPVEAPPDPAKENFKKSADLLLRQMVEHPEAGDAYWDQLKTLLRDWMNRPGASPADRQAVEDAILTTDRLRADAKK